MITAATATHHHHVPPSASFTAGEWCSTASGTAIASHPTHLSMLRMSPLSQRPRSARQLGMALLEGGNKAAATFRRASRGIGSRPSIAQS
jgi:hypothetical protein